MPRSTRFADSLERINVASVYYDFAADGGAIGPHELPGEVPAGAVILDGFYDVLTQFTTAAADAGLIALHIQNPADLLVANDVADVLNPFDPGVKDILPNGTAATAIKLTADRNVTLTVSGQALTAGKLAVHLFYVMSPNVLIDG
jgi:hypothetical protein